MPSQQDKDLITLLELETRAQKVLDKHKEAILECLKTEDLAGFSALLLEAQKEYIANEY